MPTKTQNPSVTPGDLSGGIASAVVSITGNVAAGVIAFAPLGPDYVGQGILAGMFSSIVAGLMVALFGGAPGMISGPKATTSMAFAALLSQLLATEAFDPSSPESMDLLLALAFSAVLISGSVQVLLGAFRIGALVKFMPYPVVAGIRNTTAILLILGQFWPFIGVENDGVVSLLSDLRQIQPATIAVAALTAGIAWKGGRFLPKASVPVVALVVGTLLYYLLEAVLPGARLGEVFGSLPSAIPRPEHVGSIFNALMGADRSMLTIVIGGALAMAVLDSISSLITLVTYQSIADRRFDANNQLIGQGLGSVAVAFFGGLTTSGILARAAVNHSAGGRSRASGVVNALAVLLLVVVLAPWLALIPKAAVAGLIMVIASGLFDRWTLGQVKEATRGDATHVTDNYMALGQMAFVVAVGIFVNLVAAVGAGVALSVLVFVAEMSRSPIRRVRSGAAVRSAKRRPENLTELLRSEGHRIAVIELEGTIFFGSCDALATRAEDLADEGAEFVLLDLKRVRAVDATGYKVLGQTFQRLRSRGATLAFSYVTSGGLKAEIAEDLLLNGVPEARLFESTDVALEYFEEGLLMKLGAGEARPGGWTLADFGESWGMDEEEYAILDGFLESRHFEAGDFVFREGDTGRSMYLLSRGSADVSIPIPGEGRRRRLASFAEGTIFGEMALLDGLPRAAAVQAIGPLELLELSHESFVELSTNHADIAVKLQGTIGRILGARLRGANELILELDS